MLEEILSFLARHRSRVSILLVAVLVADALIFAQIGGHAGEGRFTAYFLNVGQGDASLLVLPTGVKVLIDGGPPNGRVLTALARVLPPTDRYLDLVMMSHPQSDHFGGLIEVVERYRVGAFLMPDRQGEGSTFAGLEAALAARGVRAVTLGRGDAIVNGGTRGDILSPTPALLAGRAANDAALVVEFESTGVRSLFTGDVSGKVEAALISLVRGPVDILKVSHHGSKYSSDASFLAAVRPSLAVVEVGKNRYGHPTPEALARLAAAGARVYRTDEDGTVKVWRAEDGLNVFKSF